ncbi:MAG: (2Fe-2S)-binding protein [Gammaproteobacteria bacterium]|nr:(2Fe-2S)-binding protein [Gammaproteobacteria bacterium]
MPRVIFHDVDGRRIEADVSAGNTVMEGALDNGVAGILAECGGACACATCHAYVAEAWLPRLKPLEDMEDAMLDSTLERRPASRLMCQIELNAELDGLEVFIARNES